MTHMFLAFVFNEYASVDINRKTGINRLFMDFILNV